MANVKISGLPTTSPTLVGTELLEMVQSGTSYQTTAASVANTATNVRTVATGGTGAATLTGYVKGTGTTAMTASATIPITDITGTATVAQGGTGAATLTGYVKGTGTTAMTAAATVPVADISGTLPVANGGTGAATLTGYVKGAGTSAMTAAATIPFNDLAGHAWINSSSTLNQTGSVTTATAVTMDTGTSGTGISINASTQILFTAAGTYQIGPTLQFANSAASNYTATVWFKKNGVNVSSSATIVSVPKAADGGVTVFHMTWIETVTAGQYIEIMWLPQNVAVTLAATAAGAIAPAIPSAIAAITRIA